MTNYDQYIGKYVCYGNSDGGFCWGKIKRATRVNTPKGEVDAFILTDRTNCTGKPYVATNIRHHNGDTLIRVDRISLEHDIVVKDEMFKDLTDDELFLLVMEGEVDLTRLGNKGLGLKNLCESSTCDSEVVKRVLEGRLEK